jgi:hypothetical protein
VVLSSRETWATFRYLLQIRNWLLGDYIITNNLITKEIPGGNTDGVTPLPIPNREVKPIWADGTVLATAWESRSLPGFYFQFRGK